MKQYGIESSCDECEEEEKEDEQSVDGDAPIDLKP
jgi:hypothetical protein